MNLRDQNIENRDMTRKTKELEYRWTQEKEKMKSQYELEIKLLQEDLVYQQHTLEQAAEKTQNQLKEEIQNLQDQIQNLRELHVQEKTQQTIKHDSEIQQMSASFSKEKMIILEHHKQEMKKQEELKQSELEQWRNVLHNSKDSAIQIFDKQKQQEIKSLNDNHEYQTQQLRQHYENTLKDNKKNNDQKLCKLQDLLDLEKSNGDILRKRLIEQKKQSDQDIEAIKKERSIRIDQLQIELIQEKKKNQNLQGEMDKLKYNLMQKEQKLIDDYEQKDQELQQTFETNMTQMYQRQVEVAKQLEQQYTELDAAAEKKYNKLKQQYEELQTMMKEAMEKKSLKAMPRKSKDRMEDDGGTQMLTLLENVQKKSQMSNRRKNAQLLNP